MAAIVTGCLGAVGGMVGELIISQFNYLYCFSDNITNLKNEADNLKVLERDLQGEVQAARDAERVITHEAETWLKNSNEIKDKINGILDEVPNVGSGCFSLGARFSLSKRAEETTDRLKELLDEYRFDTNPISLQRPPASTAIPSGITYEFKSRKKIEEDIMATLRSGKVNMIGICGMGGLGKTTMAKKIRNRALEEHVFDEVVMVVVSRPIDQLKIQLEIGGSLGLMLEGECSEARVQKLHARLSGTKRILLVLDDVWEELVLEDLGIPSSYKGCTILLTSRNHDVLSAMNVQIFGMKVLSEEDSWIMFRERVGTCVDNTELNSVARKVVNECKGLPLALTVVGAALKDEVGVNAWKNAVERLEKGDPDIQGYNAKVYNPLILSYDVLEPKYQDVFLLCCVYPEDADIPLEQLTYFCMGLRIATGNVEAARNRIRALTKVLKNRSLLLDSEKGDEYVRMHDVVRDVCIFIAKQKGYIGDNDLTSSLLRYKLHSGFELLQIRYSDEEINFDGITDLYVLSIKRCSQLTSLPFTQMLRNLYTLVLDSCKGLETLLDSCKGANEVGSLINLEKIRYLELRECENMKKVVTSSMDKGGATVFPSIENLLLFKLPKLEEICDDRISSNSFQNLKILKLRDLPVLKQLWKSSQNNLGKDFLPQLEVLEIRDCEMMEAVFLWKGEEANENNSCHHTTKRFPKLKELVLWYLPNLISLCEGIEGIEFPLMRKIEIRHCGKMKGMVWNEKISGGSSNNASIHALFCPQQVSFGCLKKLDTDRNPFSELEELDIFGCHGILSLFTSSMAENLVNLKELWIEECDEMVEVIKDDEEKGMSGGRQTALLFPKLHKLKLSNLPKLVRFCESKGIESIQFPVLRSMKITGCEKMKGMVANGVTSNENNSGGDSSNASDIIHLFCQSKQVSFGCVKELEIDWNPFCSHTIHVSIFNGLEKLSISQCTGNLSLFSSSMAGNLLNLKELRISECEEMVEVIKDDEEKGMSGGRQWPLVFPKLEMIVLLDLPKLVSFCELKCDVEFPSLKIVDIHNCPNMKNFTLGSLAAPNLESFVTDLNNYLQVPFISLKILTVCVNEKPLNCYQIDGSVFDRLEVLAIRWYEGSMSLFSSSITGNLVNLAILTIRECDRMVNVIEEKEEEKEKVVSGAQTTTILFPKLQEIELEYLPKLVRFCEWKCDVELPSLRELKIYKCDNMKRFTLGHLNTPKLESVEINRKGVGGVKDLNGFLQQRYLSGEEEKEKTKKKNGQLEIKEEQN